MTEEEKAEKVPPLAKVLINEAESKYPLNLWFKGKMTEEDLSEILKKCYANRLYMDGSVIYSIRYKII